MNQEQNNLNSNNFNIQGNDGITNNVPLNNQSMNFNQQPINSQPQLTPSFSQPIMQETMPQPFESGNDNNQDFNNKPPKKMNLGLVIGIIAAVVVVAIAGVFISNKIIFNQGSNNNSESNKPIINNTNSDKIIKFSINRDSILALTNSEKLYGIGNVDGLGSGIERTDIPTLLASNVKTFKDEGGLYYLDNNNTLYRTGWNYEGGILDTFKKTYENVIHFDASMSFCLSIVTEDNQAYIDKNFGDSYCGLDDGTDGFKKVSDNVNMAISSYYYHGYIDKNNSLYISKDGKQYEKLLENIIDYQIVLSGDIYLDNNGNLYLYAFDYETQELKLELLLENVEEISYVYGIVKKEDNHFYKINLYNNEVKIDIIELDDNIRNILYYYNDDKIIYLNDKEEIVMYYQGEQYKTLDNTVDSIKDMLNFIS